MADTEKSYAFDAFGRSLEALVSMTEEGFKVRVMEAGRPVTNVVYSVTYETAIDAYTSSTVDLVASLVEVAQEDVRRRFVRLAKPLQPVR